jgi:histidinol-phosphate aminotransferase
MRRKQIRQIAQIHGYAIYWSFLRHSRGWDLRRRTDYILRHLRQTLVRAYEGTLHYRAAFDAVGFDPRRDFRGVETLRSLPLLTKEMVRQQPGRLHDSRFMAGSVLAETSGTTGEPLRMRLNERYVAFDDATMFRYWAQVGYRFRDRFVALRSYVPKTERDPLWYHNKAQNCLFMSAYHLTPKNAREYVQAVLTYDPKFLRGYPSSLSVFAEYAYPLREKFANVQGLFTASETLTPGERSVIEATFGQRLFDWYGMTEPVLIITEALDHKSMEVNWEYGFAEFLPSPELQPGQFRLVATSFHNPVMPFIRYDTGDIVHLGEGSPADGLFPIEHYPPPVLTLAGRKDECIVTPDGRRLPSVNFYTVFRDQKEVLKFQIVQYGLSDVVVKLALRPGVTDTAQVLAGLRRSLLLRIGTEVRIEFDITDKFITNTDGKTIPILRRSGSRSVEENEEYAISSQQAWLPENAGLQVLKLDWNEADRTPCEPHVRGALQRLLDDRRYLNWYPEAESQALTHALSLYTAVSPDQLLVTHGSDAAIESVGVAFVRPGDRCLIVQPTYDNFRSSIEQHGATSLFVRYDGRSPFPVEDICQRVTLETPRILYLNNPNNPIGYAVELLDLERLIRFCAKSKVLVVVDEAYFEFCGVTVSLLTKRYPNAIALRTFSKAFGLAGLRLGYVLASPELARVLRRVVNPKSVTMFAKAAALTALEHIDEMRAYVEEVAASRQRLAAFFLENGITSWPSRANFILFEIDRPDELLRHFAAARIFFRDRSRYFPGGRHVRMTVGSLESTERVIEVFEQFLYDRQAQRHEAKPCFELTGRSKT